MPHDFPAVLTLDEHCDGCWWPQGSKQLDCHVEGHVFGNKYFIEIQKVVTIDGHHVTVRLTTVDVLSEGVKSNQREPICRLRYSRVSKSLGVARAQGRRSRAQCQ